MGVGDASTGRVLRGPTAEEAEAHFRQKYGDPKATGWGPRLRRCFAYRTPDDRYELLVDRLVGSDTTWLDVGCGRALLPDNERLSRELSERCRRLVGVDPDETIDENPWVHEKVRSTIDEYAPDEPFDLVTLRMVAEHVDDPARAVRSLSRLVIPGGRVVVYTTFRWSPIPLVTSLVPFGLHHPVKRALWRTEAKDTFPVANRLNTRGALARHFGACGLREVSFAYLDDCRTLARFRVTHFLELGVRRLLRAVGLRYPEVCLLGVYEAR